MLKKNFYENRQMHARKRFRSSAMKICRNALTNIRVCEIFITIMINIKSAIWNGKIIKRFFATLDETEKSIINAGYYFYVVDLKNVGGLVMPVIFKVEYMDGTSEEIRIPAEIWRYDNFNVSKLIVTKKEAKAIVLDPNLETADADLSNNFFPRRTYSDTFSNFQIGQRGNCAACSESNVSTVRPRIRTRV